MVGLARQKFRAYYITTRYGCQGSHAMLMTNRRGRKVRARNGKSGKKQKGKGGAQPSSAACSIALKTRIVFVRPGRQKGLWVRATVGKMTPHASGRPCGLTAHRMCRGDRCFVIPVLCVRTDEGIGRRLSLPDSPRLGIKIICGRVSFKWYNVGKTNAPWNFRDGEAMVSRKNRFSMCRNFDLKIVQNVHGQDCSIRCARNLFLMQLVICNYLKIKIAMKTAELPIFSLKKRIFVGF